MTQSLVSAGVFVRRFTRDAEIIEQSMAKALAAAKSTKG